MTPQRRAEIFSKEALSINDLADLMEVSYSKAAQLIRQIKFKYDRLGIEGKLHILDYMDFINAKRDDVRYSDVDFGVEEQKTVQAREEWWRKSVCVAR